MNFPDILFSTGLDQALGWTVLHSIWQATLIALLTGALLVALRRRPARLRYWVGNLALLAVLLAAAGTFCWYYRPAAETAGIGKALPGPIPAADFRAAPGDPGHGAVTLADSEAPVRVFDYFRPHLPMITCIWFLGIAAFLLRLLGNLSYVYYLRQRMNFTADPYWSEVLEKMVRKSGLRRSVELLESALIRSPLTIGHLKPLIMFPIGVLNRLSETEVEAILAHELAHILRRDYLFNILQNLMESLFYYHPAVWWLSAQVRNERENASDDVAIDLLGNKLNYAKALVALQEMAYYRATPALAFAGRGRSQFLTRLQRIFKQPKTTFNIMEKWIATGLVVCSILVLGIGQHTQPRQNTTDVSTETISGPNTGIWEAEFQNDSVCLHFNSKDRNWGNSLCALKSAFSGLQTVPGDTEFRLVRPAGTMTMTGRIEGATGLGRYVFAPDESYRGALNRHGFQNVGDDLMMQLFFAGFPADYAAMLKKNGYDQLSNDELMQLAVFRLDEQALRSYADLAASLGSKQPSVEQVVQLKVSNVTHEQVTQLAKAGYKNLSLDDVSAFGIHHVDPAFIESMNSLGFGALPADELMAAKVHGIDAAFVKQCRDMGFANLSFEDVMAAKIHGVDPAFVRQCADMGFNGIQFDDVMAAKVHGIDPAFVKQCVDMGFPNLSFDDIMAAKVHGIDPAFAKQCRDLGFANLSFDDIMAARVHGVDAAFVKRCKDMGFTNLSFDDVMTAKVHELDPAFVKQCRDLGFANLSFDDIMSARVHGVDAAFVKQCRDMGFANLSFDEIMAAKVHGLDEASVREYRNLGIKDLSFEDVMGMRIHGVTPETVKTFRDLGFKNMTAEDLLSARIHDVTPAFIKEAEERGYRFPTLSEYAELKEKGLRRKAD